MARTAVLLLAVVLLASGCQGPIARNRREGRRPVALATPSSAVVIEVFGTQGLRFEGSYGEFGQSTAVAGEVPRTLTFRTGLGFSVALQKRTQAGELGLRVIVDGKVVSQSATTKAYGVVTYVHRMSAK